MPDDTEARHFTYRDREEEIAETVRRIKARRRAAPLDSAPGSDGGGLRPPVAVPVSLARHLLVGGRAVPVRRRAAARGGTGLGRRGSRTGLRGHAGRPCRHGVAPPEPALRAGTGWYLRERRVGAGAGPGPARARYSGNPARLLAFAEEWVTESAGYRRHAARRAAHAGGAGARRGALRARPPASALHARAGQPAGADVARVRRGVRRPSPPAITARTAPARPDRLCSPCSTRSRPRTSGSATSIGGSMTSRRPSVGGIESQTFTPRPVRRASIWWTRARPATAASTTCTSWAWWKRGVARTIAKKPVLLRVPPHRARLVRRPRPRRRRPGRLHGPPASRRRSRGGLDVPARGRFARRVVGPARRPDLCRPAA